MDDNGNKEIRGNKKPYRTPQKLMVLGGIDAVVQAGTSVGTDANAGTSTAS
jgi:hypothetical protein